MLKHFPCAALVLSLFCACPCDQEKQRLANSTTQNRAALPPCFLRAANTVCGCLRPLRSAWTQQTAALARTVLFLCERHKNCGNFNDLAQILPPAAARLDKNTSE